MHKMFLRVKTWSQSAKLQRLQLHTEHILENCDKRYKYSHYLTRELKSS